VSPAAALRRVALVFTRPSAAFAGLAESRTEWLVPAVLVSLLVVIPGQTVLRPLYLEKQQTVLENYVERGVLTEEQAHEAQRRVQDQTSGRSAVGAILQGVLGLVLQVGLRYALPAALLTAGAAFIMEARARYTGVLGAVAFASVPAGLREIVRTPLQLARGSLDVYFSPAVLTGTKGLGGFALNIFDLFDLWILGLLVIALALVTGTTRARSAGLVLPLWGVYSLLKFGLKASPLGAGL
jgi:hypothetical protein